MSDAATFRLGFVRFGKGNRQLTAQQMRALGFQAAGDLIEVTPVDTGFAQNNWRFGPVGFTPATDRPAVDDGGASAVADLTSAIENVPDEELFRGFDIANAVDYIGALENGHSTQAPNGMVGGALDRIRAQFGDL